jgi:Fe2+ transport system protein B
MRLSAMANVAPLPPFSAALAACPEAEGSTALEACAEGAESVSATAEILRAGGWTTLTGLCLMLFSLLHNPCSTTIFTIYKETRSVKSTTVATVLPLVLGVAVCFVVAQVWRVAGGV